MKFLKDWLAGTVIVTTISLLVLFASPVLNNVHNTYIRVLASGVVKLTNSEGNAGATGFVVRGASGEKYIMTNNHVCNLAENGVLTAEYSGERFPVQVFKKYEWNDLCALVAHRPLGMALGVASSASIGESTWVVGHPLLEPRSMAVGELSGTVFIKILAKVNPAKGECEGPTMTELDTKDTIYAVFGIGSLCIRTLEANASTMSIQPGNSGSPAVNLYGNVVAVAFAANESGTRSYFVPLEDLKQFLNRL
jgi:S1-C subfamily serine protease